MAYYVQCSACGNHVFHVNSCHRNCTFMICDQCRGNLTGLNSVKNTFSLIQQAKYVELQAALKKEKEKNLTDLLGAFGNNEQHSTFFTEKVVGYMQRHQDFLRNLKNSNTSKLERHVKQSLARMLPKVEKKILGIIGHEAHILSESIKVKDESVNELKIKKAEEFREKLRKDIPEIRVESEELNFSLEAQDQNPEDESLFLFDNSEVAEGLTFIEKKIEKLRMKSTVLSKLVKEGENIAGELLREKPDALNLSKISSITKVNESKKEESKILENEE